MSFIETDRLAIRSWTPGDLPAVERIVADGETMRFIGMGYPNGWGADQAAGFLKRATERFEREGIGIWPVTLKDTGELVGHCGLQTLPPPYGDMVEIGWLVGKEHRRKGYAYEAAAAVLRWGETERKLPRIYAVIHPFNRASIGLANKLAMRFDRVRRVYKIDALTYVHEPEEASEAG